MFDDVLIRGVNPNVLGMFSVVCFSLLIRRLIEQRRKVPLLLALAAALFVLSFLAALVELYDRRTYPGPWLDAVTLFPAAFTVLLVTCLRSTKRHGNTT